MQRAQYGNILHEKFGFHGDHTVGCRLRCRNIFLQIARFLGCADKVNIRLARFWNGLGREKTKPLAVEVAAK